MATRATLQPVSLGKAMEDNRAPEPDFDEEEPESDGDDGPDEEEPEEEFEEEEGRSYDDDDAAARSQPPPCTSQMIEKGSTPVQSVSLKSPIR